MRNILYLIISVFIFLLFSGEDGCSGPEKSSTHANRSSKSIEDDLTSSLTGSYLSSQTLIEMDEDASQILMDAVDYLQIYTDTSIDLEFRKETLKSLEQLFISDNCVIDLGNKNNSGIKISALSRTEENKIFSLPKELILPIDSVWVSQNLSRLNDTIYAGQLSFHSETNGISGNHVGTADFFAVKKDKMFGEKRLPAWIIYLGNVTGRKNL